MPDSNDATATPCRAATRLSNLTLTPLYDSGQDPNRCRAASPVVPISQPTPSQLTPRPRRSVANLRAATARLSATLRLWATAAITASTSAGDSLALTDFGTCRAGAAGS